MCKIELANTSIQTVVSSVKAPLRQRPNSRHRTQKELQRNEFTCSQVIRSSNQCVSRSWTSARRDEIGMGI